ncbi:MAG TPA: hypothetical protein PLU30_10905 [Verrucomicrobiae bacterium]|nr:hypothetical protein [Verrucomicrobiae bacterium]
MSVVAAPGIPGATLRKLQSPPPVGSRHAHARDVSFALVGAGWDEPSVFALMRPLYDRGSFPDGELRWIIRGAVRRRPSPETARDPHAEQPAAKKPPELRRPSDANLKRISEVRGIGIEGVRLCAERGLLWRADICGHPSWVVADATRRGMQARRLDGRPYPAVGGLCERKAHNPSGTSTRHPVGLPEAAGKGSILLVEGSADFVAAHHLLWCEEREGDAAVVCMLGAGLAIPAADLAALSGRRVRMVPHLDAGGMRACGRWCGQLREVGCGVDAFSLDGLRKLDGTPVCDLNDLLLIHPDDFEMHRALWSLVP